MCNTIVYHIPLVKSQEVETFIKSLLDLGYIKSYDIDIHINHVVIEVSIESAFMPILESKFKEKNWSYQ